MLRRKYILLLGLLMFGIPKLTHAQVNFVTGSLTAQAVACPTSPGPSSSSTSALTISTVGYGGATFTLGSSAFSATVSFYGSGDGGTTWQPLNTVASNATSAVLTATATGLFQTNVAGYTNVCMVVTTFVSGTVTARIQLSTISARAGGGVSGGGLPAGCTSPGTGQITCTGNFIAQAIIASGSAAQCINLYVSGGYPNGNFYGECAPASMAASLQYTEVTADGTAGQAKVTDGAQHYKFLSFASGISNFNQTIQSQVVVSGTEYYLTRSDLDMPAVYTQAIAAGTTMTWRIALTKTAAGTGTFQINIKKGTAGSIADTSIVTQTIGTQTAAADNMECDIQLTWTSATAAYWTMIPHQAAATGTGFGLVYPATAAQFSGTISGQTTTTASDKYGLSVIFTTGTPTFVVNYVKAQAFGVN